MKNRNSFNADAFLMKDEKLWKELEQHCLVECCGIDAFDFSTEAFNEVKGNYNLKMTTIKFSNLIEALKENSFNNVGSSIFWYHAKKDVFIFQLERIKKAIIKLEKLGR